MTTKKCGKCGNIKPIVEFSLNRGKADGYHYWCKVCAEEIEL